MWRGSTFSSTCMVTYVTMYCASVSPPVRGWGRRVQWTLCNGRGRRCVSLVQCVTDGCLAGQAGSAGRGEGGGGGGWLLVLYG